MAGNHVVTQVAIIRHPDRGVLLVHSQDRRWHLPDATLGPDDDWLDKLRTEIAHATRITELQIDGVQQIDTFAAGVVGAEPHYGVFLACSTRQDEVMPGGDVDDHRWVAGRDDLDELRDQLFHPLIEDLALTRLRDESIWPLQ